MSDKESVTCLNSLRMFPSADNTPFNCCTICIAAVVHPVEYLKHPPAPPFRVQVPSRARVKNQKSFSALCCPHISRLI